MPRRSVSDNAIVIRGGLLADRTAAADSALAALRDPDEGIHGLSCQAFESSTEDDAMRRTTMRHRQVRMATAGRLRDAGFDVHATFGSPHVTVEIPNPLTAEAWRRRSTAFAPPQANPYSQ